MCEIFSDLSAISGAVLVGSFGFSGVHDPAKSEKKQNGTPPKEHFQFFSFTTLLKAHE
jgi:hypothetical protein